MTIRINPYSRMAMIYARAPHTGYPRNPAATALRKWLAENPEASPKEMALLCGVHQMTILYLRNGRRRAGPMLARKIELLTKGAVPRTLWHGVRIRPPLRDERQPELGLEPPQEVYGALDDEDETDDVPAQVKPVQGELF